MTVVAPLAMARSPKAMFVLTAHRTTAVKLNIVTVPLGASCACRSSLRSLPGSTLHILYMQLCTSSEPIKATEILPTLPQFRTRDTLQLLSNSLPLPLILIFWLLAALSKPIPHFSELLVRVSHSQLPHHGPFSRRLAQHVGWEQLRWQAALRSSPQRQQPLPRTLGFKPTYPRNWGESWRRSDWHPNSI